MNRAEKLNALFGRKKKTPTPPSSPAPPIKRSKPHFDKPPPHFIELPPSFSVEVDHNGGGITIEKGDVKITVRDEESLRTVLKVLEGI